MKTFPNTAQKGSVRYIVFKEKKTWYAVALEFNIIESGEDPQLVLFRLFEAIKGYVASFKKVKGARPYTLNQKSEDEYEKLWIKLRYKKPIRSPYTVHTFGERNLALV
ncbi:MAG: hypothetical protein AAB758_02345 [Patescibacteria group bacterium]